MSERRTWADIAKGIGVFLVVLGHIPTIPAYIRAWIFSFHMPLFYFISGCFYHYENERVMKYIERQAKAMLIPYLYYSVVFICLDWLLLNEEWMVIKNNILNTLFGQGGNDILWFFVSLFWVKVIFHIVRKTKWCRYLLTCVTVVGLFLLSKNIVIPLKFGTSLVAIAFYWCGYELKGIKEKSRINCLGAICGITNLTVSFFLILNFGLVMDINSGVYVGGIAAIAAGISGSLCACEFAKLFREHWLPVKMLMYIGENSKFFYPLTGYIPGTSVALLEKAGMQVGAIIKIITKVIGFLATWGITEIANRITQRNL